MIYLPCSLQQGFLFAYHRPELIVHILSVPFALNLQRPGVVAELRYLKSQCRIHIRQLVYLLLGAVEPGGCRFPVFLPNEVGSLAKHLGSMQVMGNLPVFRFGLATVLFHGNLIGFISLFVFLSHVDPP